MAVLTEYRDDAYMLFVFENGKGVRVPISAYQTKTNRRKLTAAYADSSPLAGAMYLTAPCEVMLVNNANRAISLKSELIPEKSTRSSVGVQIMQMKRGQKVTSIMRDFEGHIANASKYHKIKIPAASVLLEEYDINKTQIRFTDEEM